jgi:hypothetical protein
VNYAVGASGTAQVGTAQVGTGQVGTAQVGIDQIGTAQVGVLAETLFPTAANPAAKPESRTDYDLSEFHTLFSTPN